MSDNGRAIRPTAWEGCPKFSRMWEYLYYVWSHPAALETDKAQIVAVSRWLADARVVKVEESYLSDVNAALTEALSSTVDAQGQRVVGGDALRDAGALALDSPLPFSPLWIEFAGETGSCDGLLIVERATDTVYIPYLETTIGKVIPCAGVRSTDGGEQYHATYHFVRGRDDALVAPGSDNSDPGQFIMPHAYSLLNALLSVLLSVNVTLETEPVARQVRRAAERANRPIPLTIQVTRSGRRSAPRGGVAKYSYSFERRGAFQHHTRGPIFENCKDPAKRIEHGGVECVRVWSPPTIVGDGPFIPKVRFVAAPEIDQGA